MQIKWHFKQKSNHSAIHRRISIAPNWIKNCWTLWFMYNARFRKLVFEMRNTENIKCDKSKILWVARKNKDLWSENRERNRYKSFYLVGWVACHLIYPKSRMSSWPFWYILQMFTYLKTLSFPFLLKIWRDFSDCDVVFPYELLRSLDVLVLLSCKAIF